MIHCTYSSVCKSVIVKFILPNLLKTLSSSVIGVQPNLFAWMSALVLLCIDGFTGFQNRLFCICTLICHLVRVKLLNTVFFPFIELEIPGALDSYPWRRMRMLMQRFVLVTRLSGMVGSFLWRSRRHLHGESSTLELVHHLGAPCTIVQEGPHCFTLHRFYWSENVTYYRYYILGTCRKIT